MSISATISSTVSATISNVVQGITKLFIDLFGANLAAAYFIKDLGSKRGEVDGAINPVVRVRRNSGDLLSFPAKDVSSGVMLDWVKRPGAFVNDGYETFSNNATGDGFTVTNSFLLANASSSTVSGTSGDVVTVDFDIVVTTGSPALFLRQNGGIPASNSVDLTTDGSKSITLTATGAFNNFNFGEGDNPSEFTVSNCRFSTADGLVNKLYDGALHPTTAGTQVAMNFDGLASHVSVNAPNFQTSDNSGKITFNLIMKTVSTASLFAAGNTNSSTPRLRSYVDNNGAVIVKFDGVDVGDQSGTVKTANNSILANVNYEIEISSTGSNWVIKINGATKSLTAFDDGNTGQWFNELSANAARYITLGYDRKGVVSSSLNDTLDGTIYDFKYYNPSNVLILHWQGYGDSNSNWEDQAGSVDATVYNASGTFDPSVAIHYDAVQDTVANMPKIVEAGALVTEGILFDGDDDFLETSFSPGTASSQSLFTIFQATTVDGNFRTPLDARDTNDDGIGFGIATPIGFRFHVDAADRNATPNTNKEMLSGIYGASASALYQKGTQVSTGSAPSALSGVAGNYIIGNTGDGTGSTSFAGPIMGIFIYSADKSSQRIAIEASLAKSFNITLD